MQYWLLRVCKVDKMIFSGYVYLCFNADIWVIQVLILCIFNFGDLDLTCPHIMLCLAIIKKSPIWLEPKVSVSVIVWTRWRSNGVYFQPSSSRTSDHHCVFLKIPGRCVGGGLNVAELLWYMIQAAQKVSSHPDVTLLM